MAERRYDDREVAAIFKSDDAMKALDQKSGLEAAWSILRYGDTADNLSKQQLSESHLGEKLGLPGTIADVYINFVFRTLSAEDALLATSRKRLILQKAEIGKRTVVPDAHASKIPSGFAVHNVQVIPVDLTGDGAPPPAPSEEALR